MHIWGKKKVSLSLKGEICSEISKDNFFFKSLKLLTSRARRTPIQKPVRTAGSGYVTHHWNWMNGYRKFWMGGLSWKFSAGIFCNFFKLPFAISPHFLLFETSKPLFCQIRLLRSIEAYLCPNMIHFDGVGFRECRSEEDLVISFLRYT